MMRMRDVASSAVLVLWLVKPGAAQVAPQGSGFQVEYLAELTVAEDHLVRLAEVIPAAQYSWRPREGVRSVSEVLLHVAGSNFNLPRVLGLVPGDGMVGSDYDKSLTDKDAVVATLRESFTFLRASIEKLTAAQAEKKIPWFDGETTYRGVLYFMARHTGEHTGQLIAYARFIGIVPPWSESGGEPEAASRGTTPDTTAYATDSSVSAQVDDGIVPCGAHRRYEAGHESDGDHQAHDDKPRPCIERPHAEQHAGQKTVTPQSARRRSHEKQDPTSAPVRLRSARARSAVGRRDPREGRAGRRRAACDCVRRRGE